MRSAMGKVSKMNDSIFMPVFSVGFTVSPDSSAYGIFLRATW